MPGVPFFFSARYFRLGSRSRFCLDDKLIARVSAFCCGRKRYLIVFSQQSNGKEKTQSKAIKLD